MPYRDGKLVGEFPHLGGLRYYPGDPLDKMVESFGGPHDFFRNLTGAYDEMGNAIHFTGLLGNVQNYGLNYGLLIPAAPFAAAGLVPPSMYDALRVSRPW